MDLVRVGIANQTTMLKGETEDIGVSYKLFLLYIFYHTSTWLEISQTTCINCFVYLLGKLLEKTMMTKFGIENVNDHFMSFNTICDATQVIPRSLLSSLLLQVF